MSNYANEAGEPYMTAAALNFEAALDEQYAAERYLDDDEFFGDEPEDGECCANGDRNRLHDGTWVCSWCGEEDPESDDEPDFMEDQWLDGSYEE